jgi:hypothetical protein
MSDLGGCRRATGYRLAGYPAGEPKGSIQAIMGTATHDAVTVVLKDMRERGEIPASSVIDELVMFGGVRGHPDLYVDPIVRDVKTLGYGAQLDKYRADGPPLRHRWQAHTYGAALRLTGHRVTTVQLDYIVRDSGDTWLFEEPFSVDLVRDAFDWLRDVRETELDFLPRDYRPDSIVCKSCPFHQLCWGDAVPDRDELSVLYVEDPDGLKWQSKLKDARRRLADAKADEEEAKGALDALRPNSKGRGEVAIEGADQHLRWTISPTGRMDMDEVRADYARGGIKPPLKEGETVKLSLVAPKVKKGEKRDP